MIANVWFCLLLFAFSLVKSNWGQKTKIYFCLWLHNLSASKIFNLLAFMTCYSTELFPSTVDFCFLFKLHFSFDSKQTLLALSSVAIHFIQTYLLLSYTIYELIDTQQNTLYCMYVYECFCIGSFIPSGRLILPHPNGSSIDKLKTVNKPRIRAYSSTRFLSCSCIITCTFQCMINVELAVVACCC